MSPKTEFVLVRVKKLFQYGSNIPHRRRAQIVQSCSPGGAYMYPLCIIHADIDTQRDHALCDIYSDSPHLVLALAMRYRNESYCQSHRPTRLESTLRSSGVGVGRCDRVLNAFRLPQTVADLIHGARNSTELDRIG